MRGTMLGERSQFLRQAVAFLLAAIMLVSTPMPALGWLVQDAFAEVTATDGAAVPEGTIPEEDVAQTPDKENTPTDTPTTDVPADDSAQNDPVTDTPDDTIITPDTTPNPDTDTDTAPAPAPDTAPDSEPKPGPDPESKPEPEPEITVDYAALTDVNAWLESRQEAALDDPAAADMATPGFDALDVENTVNGVMMTAGVLDDCGKRVTEYGFVWSLTGATPSVTANDGMAAFHDTVAMGSFSHTLPGQSEATVRAYVIFDNYVYYTAPLSCTNPVDDDGYIQPRRYARTIAAAPQGETLVFGEGGSFDIPIIQLPAAPWPMGTGFYLNSGWNDIDPEETIYVVIKGSIVGVPFLDINGTYIGALQSTANEEYYIIPVSGRVFNPNQNIINIVMSPFVPGWMYIDNIQFVRHGGPGVLDGKTARVDDIAFQGYNFTKKTAGYQLTVDGVAQVTSDISTRMVTSLTVDGNKMYASQKYMNVTAGTDQTINTTNTVTDGIITNNGGTLTLAAAIVGKPTSAQSAQEADEVIYSIDADTIQYEDNEGPHEYRLHFDYDRGYYSTGVKGPLRVTVTAESVFGKAVSYIVKPKTGTIDDNKFKSDPDEGVGTDGLLKNKKDAVPADQAQRVYGYETTFDVTTNGAYSFQVVGPDGTTEDFTLTVTNIDNCPPELELVGDANMTMLEDTPFVELGYDATDNNSIAAEIVLRRNGIRDDQSDIHIGSGDTTITYTATDEAGNVTTVERKITVKRRPLAVQIDDVTNGSNSKILSGKIQYLGTEELTEKGLVWGTSPTPTVDSDKSYAIRSGVANTSTFSHEVKLSTLLPNVKYYVRAYAKTASGAVVYSAAQSFDSSNKKYGDFTITAARSSAGNKTITLTVTRTNGSDGTQKVTWRTLDGSAIAGYHYTAASGTLTFAPGETSKDISVKLKATPTSGKYRWEIAQRQFYVELQAVTGGGNLVDGQNIATVSCTDTDKGKIQTTGLNQWVVVSKNTPKSYHKYGGAAFGRRNYMHYPSEDGYDLSMYKYWGDHGQVSGKMQLVINMKASDSGLDVYTRNEGQDWTHLAGKWYNTGNGERSATTGEIDLTGRDYFMGRGLSQVRVAWSWVEFKNPRMSVKFTDKAAPTVQSIQAATGDYSAGEYLYVTARCSEIVTVADTAKLKMQLTGNGHTLSADYVTGSGTDTLVFRVKVQNEVIPAGDVTATLTGHGDNVKDLAGKSIGDGSATLSGVSIGSMPYTIAVSPESATNDTRHNVTISVAKPASHKGTGATYKYLFSTENNLTGEMLTQLQPFTSGSTVTLSGGTGEYYLHVVIQDSLGLYTLTKGPYVISNGVPSFATKLSTENWTKDDVTVTVAMDDSTLYAASGSGLAVYYRPASDAITDANSFDNTSDSDVKKIAITGGQGTFTAENNGSWAILAEDTRSGNKFFSTVTVGKIDKTAPVVKIAKDATTEPGDVATKMTGYEYKNANPGLYLYADDPKPADNATAANSGVKTAEYAFSTAQNAPTDGWQTFTDGQYVSLLSYLGVKDAPAGEYYLYLRVTDKAGNVTNVKHETAFTVPAKVPPAITVTVEGLDAGLNDFGKKENSLTAEQLTAADPAHLTARTVWLNVVLTKRADGAALSAVMLPDNQVVYNGNTLPENAALAVVDGWTVKDTDNSADTITLRYPATVNGVYKFLGMDKNANTATGTAVITAIDREAPTVNYRRTNAATGALLVGSKWVSGADGVTLSISFSDLNTALYDSNGGWVKNTGVNGIEYKLFADGEAEPAGWTAYTSGNITRTTEKNTAYTVMVRDANGNNYTQRIAITNIDTTAPYVDTTNTSFGVGKAPITMQLKFADKEMGLVKLRQIALTNSADAPSAWTDYDGAVLRITEPGTWYVHYNARDDVGNTSTGAFGPYIIDSGKPTITIDSRTSDLWEDNTPVYHDDVYKKVHTADVTVEFPAGMKEATARDKALKYQWSQKDSPSLFGWNDVKDSATVTYTTPANSVTTATFTIPEAQSPAQASGRWYLHIKADNTNSYRGFLFDNDLPVITVLGDNPATVGRGSMYVDRGATAVDSQDRYVSVTTVLDGVDTRYIDTAKPGAHVVTYTATDKAGNAVTAQRVVNVVDATPPYVKNFTLTTNEDTVLNFTAGDFTSHYDDDSNGAVEVNGVLQQVSSLSKIAITALPDETVGTLRLNGATVVADAEIPVDQLGGLSFTPTENSTASATFTYDGYDTAGNKSAYSATVTITVAAVNDAPTAQNVVVTVKEDESVSIDLTTALDGNTAINDVENGTNLAVAVGTITAYPASTTKVTAEDGKGTATVSGQTVTYTPAKDFNGKVTIPYTVSDGNLTASAKITVTVTNINDAPVLTGEPTITEAATEKEDGLLRGGQTVTVSWPAAVDADNDGIKYTIDLYRDGNKVGESVATTTRTSANWNVPALNGTYTLKVTAADPTGTTDDITSASFAIDSTKPEVDSVTEADEKWHNSNISITAKVSDVANNHSSNTLTAYYAIDRSTTGAGSFSSGAWQELKLTDNKEGAFSITGEGRNQVRVKVVDQAGNESIIKTSGVYQIDNKAPAAFTVNAELGAVSGSNANATTSLIVSGSTVDDTTIGTAVSGKIVYTYACHAGNSVTFNDNEFGEKDAKTCFTELKPNTQYTVAIRATDAAGNATTATKTLYTRAQDAQIVILTDWTSKSLTVKFTAPANPAATKYDIWLTKQYDSTVIGEKKNVSAGEHTFTNLDADTNYTLYIQAKNGEDVANTAVSFTGDAAGNFKTNDPPTVTVNTLTDLYYKAGDTITLTGTVTDTDVAFHKESKEPTVKVNFGGVEKTATLKDVTRLLRSTVTEWKWTATFIVDSDLTNVNDGTYQPTVTATDNKKEISATVTHTAEITIDRVVPAAPTFAVSDANATNADKYTNANSVTVTLNGQDNANGSGIEKLTYTLAPAETNGKGQTGSGTVQPGESITITAEGETLLTVTAIDKAGNEAKSEKTIYIDRTKPTGEATAPDTKWLKENITVTITPKDNVKVGKVYAEVTNNTDTVTFAEADVQTVAADGKVTVELTANQQNYVHYMIEDTAGNTQTYVAGPYKLDKSAPIPTFAVNEKELTTDNASVPLRGHSAAVTAVDTNDTQNDTAHVSGIAKMEYVWLPARIAENTVKNSGENVTVDVANGNVGTATTDGTKTDDGNSGDTTHTKYEWAEFTKGATIVNGGDFDGTWHLWVRITDAAGNVAVYNETNFATSNTFPAYLFDNTAPQLPAANNLTSTGGTLVNNRTYGSLDVKLPTSDENYAAGNSGISQYQYTFTTSSQKPANGDLPVFKFDNETNFLTFAGNTTVTVGGDTNKDLAWSSGVSMATEVMVMPGVNGGAYHSLMKIATTSGRVIEYAISNKTGAIVIIDSNGAEEHLGGTYNDGRIHKIALSTNFDGATKVFADDKYLGRFWFPTIQSDDLSSATVTLGTDLNGKMFKATLFGRTLDDSEGKGFIFRTNDVIGDYVFCQGIEGNVTNYTTVSDRSGQGNSATVTVSGSTPDWIQSYTSAPFLTGGTVEGVTGNNAMVDLSEYAPYIKEAEELTVSTTFKTTSSDGLQRLFGVYSPSGTRRYAHLAIGVNDGMLTIRRSAGTYGDIDGITNKVNDGKIHTVTVTAQEKMLCVYLDGILIYTDITYCDTWVDAKPLAYAGYAMPGGEVDNQFQGTLYNTHIFARALTSDEIESGNINYTDQPIALLNYTQDQMTGGGTDTYTGSYPHFNGEAGNYATAANPASLTSNAPTKISFKAVYELHEMDSTNNPNIFAINLGGGKELRVEHVSNIYPTLAISDANNAEDGRAFLLVGGNQHVEDGMIAPTKVIMLECTLDYTSKTVSGTVNGTTFIQSYSEMHNNNFTGSTALYLGSRLNGSQPANMTLYNFELYENDTLKVHYNGTHTDDGDLKDVSGNNHDATINGGVTWTVDAAIRKPDQASWAWVADDLANHGETIIDASNTAVQGKVYLHVWVRDEAGNERQVTYGPFDYDTTAPEITLGARNNKTTPTSADVTMTVSDNWLLYAEKNGKHTQYAYVEQATEMDDPANLFSDTTWTAFAAITNNQDTTTNYATATVTLSNVAASGNTAKSYYVAVEATDWLGNTATEYLFVSGDNLLKDDKEPTITLTTLGKKDGDTLLPAKAQAVQVDVKDEAKQNAEVGEMASGVNELSLQYAWSQTNDVNNVTGWQSFRNHNILRKEDDDGTWYLHVKASDNAGNTATEYVQAAMDNTEPTIALPTSSGWTKDKVTVSVTVSDAFADGTVGTPAGVKAVYYVAGNRKADYFASGAVNGSGIEDVTNALSFTVDKNGAYTVYALDNAGNETVEVYTEAKIDAIKPTVSLSPASSDWTNSDVTVTVNAADLGGSGVAKVERGNETLTAGTDGKYSFTLDADGVHNVTVTVTDGAGNTTTATGTYQIDSTAPTVTATVDPRAWTTENVTVSVTAADDSGSGVKETRCNGVPFTGNTYTVAENGTYTFTTVDNVGNVSTGQAVTINNIDRTAPTVTLTADKTDWTSSNVTVTVDATDKQPGGTNGSGVNAITCVDKDNKAVTVQDGKFTATANGTYTVTVTDKVGNSTTKSITINNIDKTKPVISSVSPNSGTVANRSLLVMAQVTETDSGVSEIKYSVKKDNTTSTEYTSAPLLSEEGTYQVTITVTDKAGNSTTSSAYTYTIDKTAPTIDIGAVTKTEKSLAVTPTVEDNIDTNVTSAVAVTSMDGTTPDGNLTPNTQYKITVTAKDKAGNTATQSVSTYTLANKPEVANARQIGKNLTVNLKEDSTTTGATYTYVVKVGDEVLGKVENTTETNVAIPLNKMSDGAITVEVTAYNKDGVGNKNTGTTLEDGTLTVNALPEVTIVADKTHYKNGEDLQLTGTAYDPADTTDGDNKAVESVTITADGKTYTATVDGQNWSLTIESEDLAKMPDGALIITATATDGDGESSSKSVTVTLDTTAPSAPELNVNANNCATPKITVTGETGAEIWYHVDDRDEFTKSDTASFSVSNKPDGIYSVEVYLKDAAGNVSPRVSASVIVNRNDPVASATPETTEWNNSAVNVDLTVSDDTLSRAGYLVSEKSGLTAGEVKTTMTGLAVANGEAAGTATIDTDGTWYLYVYGEDSFGKTVFAKYGPYRVDTTAPTVGKVTIGTNNALSVAAGDATSDVTATTYYYRVGETGTATALTGNTLTDTKPNTRYTVWARVTDNAGNTATGEAATLVTLAATPTGVTVSKSGKDFLTFTVTGNVDNTVPAEHKIVLKVGDRTVESGWTTGQTITVTLPADYVAENPDWTATGVVHTRNQIQVESATVTLSGSLTPNKAPVLAVNAIMESKVLHNGDTMTLTGMASDPENDSIYVKATINGVEKFVAPDTDGTWTLAWSVTDDNICQNTFGTFDNIAVTAEDESGNATTVTAAGRFRVDNAEPYAPNPTATLSGVVQGADGTYTVTFTEGLDRGEAGIATWRYTLDGVTQTGNGRLPAIEVVDGHHTLTAWYTDACGNEGEKYTATFTVDSTAPAFTMVAAKFYDESVTGGWVDTAKTPGIDTWFSSRVQQAFTVSEEALVDYAVTTGAAAPGEWFAATVTGKTFTVETPADGTHYIHLRATDAAGNTATAVFGPYQVDTAAPEVTITADSILPAQSHTGTATVTATGAPVVTTEYLWSQTAAYDETLAKDTDWAAVPAAPLTQTTDGNWYLYIRATDAAGNVMVERSEMMTVDATAPKITLEKSSASTGRQETVTFTVTDANTVTKRCFAAGEQTAAYFLTMDSLSLDEDSVVLTENGIYTFFAQDEAGNMAVETYEVTGLDLAAPTITVSDTPAPGTWVGADNTVTITIADDQALARVAVMDTQTATTYARVSDINNMVSQTVDGIDESIFGAVETVAGAAATRTVTIHTNGSFMLHVAAQDAAGNVTYESFGPYLLDKEAPRIINTATNTAFDVNNDVIIVSQLTAAEAAAGGYELTGYAIQDDLTTAFVPVDKQNLAENANEGTYAVTFQDVDFTVSGDTGKVTITATDAAGNSASVTLNCRVQDTTPPYYGSGIPDANGQYPDNVLHVTLNDGDSDGSLDSAALNEDFFQNGLSEALGSITITALPEHGTLTLGGSDVTVGQKIAATDLDNLIYTPNTIDKWTGADDTMRFLPADGLGNIAADPAAQVEVIFPMDYALDPNYKPALNWTPPHIVTNFTPTPNDVTLPDGWRFVNAPSRFAADDAKPQQTYTLRYTPADDRYTVSENATKDYTFSVSTVNVAFAEGTAKLQKLTTGTAATEIGYAITVTGAAYDTNGLTWASSKTEVATVAATANTITITPAAAGMSMVSVYLTSDADKKAFDYLMVQVTAADGTTGTTGTLAELETMADALTTLIDPDNISEEEKEIILAVAEETRKAVEGLDADAKPADVADRIAAIDALAQKVLNIIIDTTPQRGLAPVIDEVAGVALALGEQEITDILHNAIKHDDYIWNKTARVRFNGGGEMAKNMHDLLYRCPKCGREFTMVGEGDVIRCTACGNGATVNEYYDLIPLDDT